MKIGLCDLSFYGDASSSKMHKSQHIEWDRFDFDSKITCFTDMCFNFVELKKFKDKIKIGILIEPSVVTANTYNFMLENYKKYDIVLSHHKKFLSLIPNGQYYFFGGSWIKEEDWKNYDKTKLVSMVCSNKNFTYGHNVRHTVAKVFKDKIDLMGSGYKPIDYKLESLQPYMYQIVVENCKEPGYHTEKIIDCFATHTIPIYFGSETIFENFDPNGILMFSSLEELKVIMDNISEKDYNNRLKHVKANFEEAKNYKCAEDYIYKNILVKNNLV